MSMMKTSAVSPGKGLAKRILEARASTRAALGLGKTGFMPLPPLGPRPAGDGGPIFSLRLLSESVPVPDFSSGQYMFLSFPDHPLLKRPRPVYIASSPSERRWLEVILRDEDDWTYALRTLIANDSLKGLQGLRARVEGPHGHFCRTASASPANLVFLCSGMGAVPAQSLVRELSETSRGSTALLLWEAEIRDDIFSREALSSAGGLLSRFACVPVLSHDPLWTGERGTVDTACLEKLVPPFFGFSAASFEWNLASYWVSGPRSFVDRMASLLKARGVYSKAIHREGW